MHARRMSTLLAAALLTLTLSACGVGRDPQTYRARTPADATNANVGDLALRNAAVLPPPAGQSELAMGGDASATLSVVNVSGESDTLVSVTSPAASSVALADAAGHTLPSVVIPAHGTAGPQDFAVTLHGITTALRPGMYVALTFTFDKNGRATFQVPVRLYDTPLPRDSYAPAPPAE